MDDLDPRLHAGFAALDISAYPGRYLYVTQAYLDAYDVPRTPEEVVGLTVGDLWPGILEEGHPYHQSWSARWAAVLGGEEVGGIDPSPVRGKDVLFWTTLDEWNGVPAMYIMTVGTTQSPSDVARAYGHLLQCYEGQAHD